MAGEKEEAQRYREALEKIAELLVDGWFHPRNLEEAEVVAARALGRKPPESTLIPPIEKEAG